MKSIVQAQEEKSIRENTEKRTCRKCGKEKFLKFFPGRIFTARNYVSFLNICTDCRRIETKNYVRRAEKRVPGYKLMREYRKKSKKMGIKSDLSAHIVRSLLSKPCHYCGNNEIQMSLDRKDSHGGYTQDNVVPCCVRCNMIKSDMPWEAWEYIIPAVRNVFKLGLFGEWRKTWSKDCKPRP